MVTVFWVALLVAMVGSLPWVYGVCCCFVNRAKLAKMRTSHHRNRNLSPLNRRFFPARRARSAGFAVSRRLKPRIAARILWHEFCPCHRHEVLLTPRSSRRGNGLG